MQQQEDVDWGEDRYDQGEIYINKCPVCKREFTGHKHRVFCKECVDRSQNKG